MKQDDALRCLGEHKVVQQHDDGDLTVQSGKDLYVVTTDGKVFQEVDPCKPTRIMRCPVCMGWESLKQYGGARCSR
jgi:hypothetical protein